MSESNPTTAELCVKVKQPTTTVELLQNLKFILDHDLLLREDFYTREVIEAFLGGEAVELSTNHKNDQKNLSGTVGKFSKFTPSIPQEHYSTADLGVLYLSGISHSGKIKSGRIEWENLKPEWQIPFVEWQRVLGKPSFTLFNEARSSVKGPRLIPLCYLSKFPDREKIIHLFAYQEGPILYSEFVVRCMPI